MRQYNIHRNRIKNIASLEQTADNVYLNVNFRNNGLPESTIFRDNYPFAFFDTTRTNDIIEDGRDYYLSVARFRIPSQSIPIWIAPIRTGQSDLFETNIRVGLAYDETVIAEYVQYIKQNHSPLPSDITGIITEQPQRSTYAWVYNIQNICDMINAQFDSVLTALKAQEGDIPAGLEAPRMIFDPSTNRFSIIVRQNYYDLDNFNQLAFPIKILWNSNFDSLFGGAFHIFDPSANADINAVFGTNVYQLDTKFNLNNKWQIPNDQAQYTDPWLEMWQEYQTVQNLNPAVNLAFESNLSNVRGELTQDQQGFVRVLTDFEPVNLLGNEVRTLYSYQAGKDQVRLIDIIDNTALKKLDIRIFWTDIYGYKHLLRIPPYGVVSLKLQFAKKSLYKNYHRTYE